MMFVSHALVALVASAATPGLGKGPSAVLGAASAVVTPLLKPLYSLEAPLQAQVLSLGRADIDAEIAEIDTIVKQNPVVVYSYPVSPFCTEALSVLRSYGCEPFVVEPGLEWFLLGPKGSTTRAALQQLTSQSSFPHVFIGGESVGGLYSGTPGLKALVDDGSIVQRLKKARAIR